MTFWATVGAVMVGYVRSVIFYLTIRCGAENDHSCESPERVTFLRIVALVYVARLTIIVLEDLLGEPYTRVLLLGHLALRCYLAAV